MCRASINDFKEVDYISDIYKGILHSIYKCIENNEDMSSYVECLSIVNIQNETTKKRTQKLVKELRRLYVGK